MVWTFDVLVCCVTVGVGVVNGGLLFRVGCYNIRVIFWDCVVLIGFVDLVAVWVVLWVCVLFVGVGLCLLVFAQGCCVTCCLQCILGLVVSVVLLRDSRVLVWLLVILGF